ncbi:YlqD family protein [Desulfofalx alkaliphila]|uniref:YlqD family protein n=1 Tax=Desulfofalx alkaliphila TaxID=105483 RepID=UPI0005510FED|nr:YlqD family protein [Desulfofalx alkaliphila]
MQSITITRPVVIKVRVTEEYKQLVAAELQRAVQRLDLELQQLDFYKKKLTRDAARQHLEQIDSQIKERLQKKQRLLDRIKEIGGLVPGTEVIHGRVESMVEIKVGDDWNQVMNVEILVENGKVLEIRQGVHNPKKVEGDD